MKRNTHLQKKFLIVSKRNMRKCLVIKKIALIEGVSKLPHGYYKDK